ncbi:MAG: dTDP-4-dehydrorhamnose reductase [Candidatus Buchananbacteria bacterium]|nr:dTDP-4-dehydrorhamnose reductase [Candidatus Buchananbacteria bacterium]
MAKKVLILGAKGMLGTALMAEFFDLNPVGLDREDIDITDQNQVNQKILNLRPDLIINAAAYTDVDGAESNQDLANAVNGTAVGYVAAAAKQVGAILVHYSTDYVFDGQNQAGYNEDDQPNSINAYGRSKLLGEEELQKNTDQFYLIRTAWLYGPSGKNFVDTILSLAKTKESLKVVNDQFGRPTYTIDLAHTTRKLLESNSEFGIYHFTNQTKPEGITWFDFASEAIKLSDLKTAVVPCSTKDFPRPAKRPNYGVLQNNKSVTLRNWQEALKDYLSKKI